MKVIKSTLAFSLLSLGLMACSPAGQKTGQYDLLQRKTACTALTGVVGTDMQVPEMGVVFIINDTEVAECSVDKRGVTVVEVF